MTSRHPALVDVVKILPTRLTSLLKQSQVLANSKPSRRTRFTNLRPKEQICPGQSSIPGIEPVIQLLQVSSQGVRQSRDLQMPWRMRMEVSVEIRRNHARWVRQELYQ